MKFSTKEDLETPIDRAFEMLTNFELFERTAIRRGVEIERVIDSPNPMVGMAWDARFDMRGRSRKVVVTLSELDQPNTIRFNGVGQGVDGYLLIDLLPLSARSTRLSVMVELEPKTLSSRLLLQSMRLAKTNLNRRFRKKIREFIQTL